MSDPELMRPREEAIDWADAGRFLRACLGARDPSLQAADLDDLTQEALIRLVRAVRRGEVANLNALMYELARCTDIDFIRRWNRWRKVFGPMPEGEIAVAAPPSPDGSALGDPIERFRFIALEFFHATNAPCRELAEFYFRGLDWQSVAARLGRSHEAVRKQWSRCVQRLKAVAPSNVGWLAIWLREE